MATSPSLPVSPQRIIDLADGPAVTGIAVLGSAARGDADEWSDVDVESTVAELGAKWETRPSFADGRLVMCHSITAAEQWRQLELPDKAIWAVPSYAAMLVVLDRDGGLGRLQAACRTFDYGPLRPAATAYIRQKAASSSEYVFKIRSAAATHDESKALHAAAALTGRCERITSVAFLLPIRTENEYYRVVQRAAGPAWTSAHRAAFGLDGGDAFAQAAASVALFRETVRLVADRLDDETRAVIDGTLDRTS